MKKRASLKLFSNLLPVKTKQNFGVISSLFRPLGFSWTKGNQQLNINDTHANSVWACWSCWLCCVVEIQASFIIWMHCTVMGFGSYSVFSLQTTLMKKLQSKILWMQPSLRFLLTESTNPLPYDVKFSSINRRSLTLAAAAAYPRKQVWGFYIFQLRALSIQLGFNFMTAKFCNYSVGTAAFAFQFMWDFDALGVTWTSSAAANFRTASSLIGGCFQEFRGILGRFCVFYVLDYPAPHLNGRILQIVYLNLFVSLQVKKLSLAISFPKPLVLAVLFVDRDLQLAKFFVLRLEISFQIC